MAFLMTVLLYVAAVVSYLQKRTACLEDWSKTKIVISAKRVAVDRKRGQWVWYDRADLLKKFHEVSLLKIFFWGCMSGNCRIEEHISIKQ